MVLSAISGILRKVTGDPAIRNLKRVRPIIERINAHCDEYDALNDDELRGKTDEFRRRLADGEALDDLLPEAFAAVKQVCKRKVGQTWQAAGLTINWNDVPFDVQLCGAIYLHQGNIAEMATGEGKTLVATMPLYLNALEGKGAHLVTTNDFLARFGQEWVGPIYESLGMTVGCIVSEMTPEQRREAYGCDITYGTNNEFGFDYLRDNMAWHPDNTAQRRGHNYAIVDEVDSVLIDEARTPLIISGQVDRSTHQYDEIKPMVYKLVQRAQAQVNDIVAEAEQLLKEAEAEGLSEREREDKRYAAGIKLLQGRKASPKHKRLIRVSGEGWVQRLINRVEADYMRDKRMPELEQDLLFVVDERGHSIDLTDKGRQTISPEDPDLFLLRDVVEEFAEIERREDLSAEEQERAKEAAMTQHEHRAEQLHNISQMLRAYILFERDREYIIEDNKVVIIDENTGRRMPGRRWSDGLHQAVEAKEGVTIEKETQTLATITLQNYFRMYTKLAGMTGTAETEASEFAHTYNMDVMVMPTNRPIRRMDYDDLIYKTQREKYNAIVEEVQRLNQIGLPVLVGTTSVDNSELISKMLKRARISHSVLNARNHAREAQIIAQAGQRGAVTIATNMAGRGTDIKLGPGVIECRDGTPADGKYCPTCPYAPAGAPVDKNKQPCGLQIVGSERHEARRIDRQLRGRAGRQGDPGSSRFFVSLEDDLMRLFASERMAKLMSGGFEEGQPLSHGIATYSIAQAQKKIEGINFERRKRTLDYDNVMNRQREAIYGRRRRALMCSGDASDVVFDIAADALANEWALRTESSDENDWDIKGFEDWVRRSVPFVDLDNLPPISGETQQHYLDAVMARIEQAYTRKSEVMGEEVMAMLARFVILQIIDTHWRDHLLAIDELREGIGLRSYGQKDPLVEYQREASEMFDELMLAIQQEAFEKVFRATIVREAETGASRMAFVKEAGRQSAAETARHAAAQQQAQQQQTQGGGEGGAPQRAPKPQTYRRAGRKIKPNEPCPCGSGRKYKKCCGAARPASVPTSVGAEGDEQQP